MFCTTLGGIKPPFVRRHGKIRARFAKSKIITALFTLALLQASPSYGGDLETSNILQTSIGIGAMDFDYQEFNDSERLNREQGNLFGLTAAIQGHWGKNFVEADVAWFANDVDYDGQTQNGVPVNTTTDQVVVNSAALFGRYFQKHNKFQHALVVGLGYRYWQRDINSTRTALGVLETYTWWYGQLGWRGVYQPTSRSSWLAETKLVRPFAAEIEIDFRNDFDNTSLGLGEENGLQLNLTYQFKLAKNWRLDVEGFYTAWDIGRSREATLRQNGVAIGKVFEPESETRSAGLRVSGWYAF
ncbi:MAG: hypothetical protein ACR2P1_12060 [Pseudomonadales bacterium]